MAFSNLKRDRASFLRRHVFLAWYPLWLSWLAMALENPVTTAFISRMPNSTFHLAALAGIVIPISFLIEGPVISWLSASTALIRGRHSYRQYYTYMMWMGAILSVLHGITAFTPVYDLVIVKILGLPEEIREPGRMGLRIMLPWTWVIGYRRFHQGLLIRFGRSHSISAGTAIRIVSATFFLLLFSTTTSLSGIEVGTGSIVLGVIAEAIYIRKRAQTILSSSQFASAEQESALNARQFMNFYMPLALTSILDFVIFPISSAGISRMPEAVLSFAAFQVTYGLLFVFRTPANALTEVTIAKLDYQGGSNALSSFSRILSVILGLTLTSFLLTPFSELVFVSLLGLSESVINLVYVAMWIGLLHVVLAPIKESYKGRLIHSHFTRPVTESTIIHILVFCSILCVGVYLSSFAGIVVVLFGRSIAVLFETGWLKYRYRQRKLLT